ncbi:MAG: nucleotidyl transferase AbiEii/AbiGii toxin family protein, partial [Myxococcota bacterium]
ISKKTIHSIIEDVNISFFYFPYPLLKPLIDFDNIKIADLEDILCMKVNAIIGRGSRKDFIDVYFIMKSLNIKLDDLFRLFQKKFGDYNTLIIKKAIIYFEDAENEPKFPLLKDVKWEKVKAFFIKKIKET